MQKDDVDEDNFDSDLHSSDDDEITVNKFEHIQTEFISSRNLND